MRRGWIRDIRGMGGEVWDKLQERGGGEEVERGQEMDGGRCEIGGTRGMGDLRQGATEG
jgi:hypothetical protein